MMIKLDDGREVKNILDIPKDFTGVTTSMLDHIHHCNILKQIIYYQSGQIHRASGPAIIEMDYNLKPYRSVWVYRGLIHNPVGFGTCNYYRGTVSYYLFDNHYQQEEYNRKTALIKPQLKKRFNEYKHLTDEQWHDYLNTLILK